MLFDDFDAAKIVQLLFSDNKTAVNHYKKARESSLALPCPTQKLN